MLGLAAVWPFLERRQEKKRCFHRRTGHSPATLKHARPLTQEMPMSTTARVSSTRQCHPRRTEKRRDFLLQDGRPANCQQTPDACAGPCRWRAPVSGRRERKALRGGHASRTALVRLGLGAWCWPGPGRDHERGIMVVDLSMAFVSTDRSWTSGVVLTATLANAGAYQQCYHVQAAQEQEMGQ